MDLKNLRCFVAVAEHLNFSRAAQCLYLSQPTLSTRISALEEELGTPLFYRTHQSVFLTDAGSALLEPVREILARVDSLPAWAAQARRQTEDGAPRRLRIGLDPTEERTDIPVLTEAFSHFGRDYPGVELEMEQTLFERYEAALTSGEIDLCIVVLKESEIIGPAFASCPLLCEPIVMVAADAGTADAQTLLRTREVLRLDGETRWNGIIFRFLDSARHHAKIKTVRGTNSLCMNLMYGNSIAFLPLSFAQSMDAARVSWFDLHIPDGRVCLTLVWSKQNLNPANQLMINELAKAAQNAQERYCQTQ